MDPRVRALVPLFEQFGFDLADIAATRRRFRAVCETFPPPDGVTIERRRLGGRPALSFVPSGPGGDGRRILHLHGGGFVIGDLELQLMMPSLLCITTGAEVLSLDYRIAPEHPCPAATDDAVAAFGDLAADGDVLAIAGESAGATLALLTALALRDAGRPLPDAVVAVSPWVDLAGTSRRFRDPSFHDAVLGRPFTVAAADAWRGRASVDDPRVSPLSADLVGLPPTLLHVGGDEVLLEDSLWMAQRLSEANVQVELRVFPGMPHVFPAYPSLAPECDQSLSAIDAFLTDASALPTVSASSPSPT